MLEPRAGSGLDRETAMALLRELHDAQERLESLRIGLRALLEQMAGT